MECTDALILISGHIDGENTPQEEAALQAHLSQCPSCRALLQAYEDTDKNVAALEVPAPVRLAPSIMEKLEPRKKAKKRSPWLGIGASAAAAAAVFALLIGTKTISLPFHANTVKSAESAEERYTDALADAEDLPLLMAVSPDDTEAGIEGNFYDGDGAGGSFDTRRKAAALSPSLISDCEALCEENTAPVLLYSGIGEDFFTWLADAAPALAQRIDSNSQVTLNETDGTMTLITDYTTAAALHEWFERVLLQGDGGVIPEGDVMDEILAQFSIYGFDGSHLAAVCDLPSDYTADTLQDVLPEGFANSWFSGENWKLFLPAEGYVPEAEELTFLVLVPPTE